MRLLVNAERGEVPLRIGTVDLVVAAEIGRLAALSTALECKSLAELYARLFGAEVTAIIEGVRCLAVRGDVEAALEQISLADFPAAKTAFEAAVLHHLTVRQGKRRMRRGKPGDGHGLPFREWLKAAVTVFRWRPGTFWGATVTEFAAAVEAHEEASPSTRRDETPTQEELAQLLKEHGG